VAARILELDDVVARLQSPDESTPLILDHDALQTASGDRFPILDGIPLLFPTALQKYLSDTALHVPPGLQALEPLLQYFQISAIKQNAGNHNSAPDDSWFLRHLEWTANSVRTAHGCVLDIGCDSPKISASCFPDSVTYVGLDPLYAERSQFRIAGLAEFLPFADASFDGVAFLTSLDHVFDHHRALAEAQRVLTPGGNLYLASLIWTHDAELYRDSVHFHHFREYEIIGALPQLELKEVNHYNWKNNDHREVAYFWFQKPMNSDDS
jgi:SAM-dependent methyltransferase